MEKATTEKALDINACVILVLTLKLNKKYNVQTYRVNVIIRLSFYVRINYCHQLGERIGFINRKAVIVIKRIRVLFLFTYEARF